MTRAARIPAAPRGSTGTSHARRCACYEGAPRRARPSSSTTGTASTAVDAGPKH
jgi:hypothetical protein